MDPNRLRVDRGVLHHAVTPLWEDKSKAWLAQWFSDNGFARAYGSNPANWSGLINPFTGARSYSQTHAVGQRVTAATPDATAAERAAGYRVFYIVKDPVSVITWHAGNWNINQRSIAIENLGDYRNYALRDSDMRVIAAFFRPLDQAVNGAMAILLHHEVYATACPARIAEGRDKIVQYINNPLTDPTPPAPTPNITRYEKLAPREWEFVRDANLWNFNFDTTAKMQPVTSFKKGNKLAIVGKAVHKSGSEYYMTAHSFGTGDPNNANFKPAHTNGVNKVDLKEVAKPVVTTKEMVTERATPFLTERIYDTDLLVGETWVVVDGVDGIVALTYLVTYTDGEETGRKLIREESVQDMIVEIVRVGTAPRNPVNPIDGEDAKSWLTRLFGWVMDMLSKFTFKK